MLTYNQEDFIAQAIEGVIMQKTNFRYQLVIGEDCSTDATRNICMTYAQEYPEKIKLILNERNLGLGANYVKTYKECTGKYVAICDGDDFWIDPQKLQKQVDFLENNREFNMVYSNNYNLLPSGEMEEPRNKNITEPTSFKDLVYGNYIPSVTVLFKKRDLTDNMELWIPSFPYGDWPTYLLVLSGGGQIQFLNEATAVYRKNFGTSLILKKQKSRFGEINLAILQNLEKDEIFANKKEIVKEAILKFQAGLMATYNKERKFLKSLQKFFHLLPKKPNNEIITIYLYSLKRTVLKKRPD